MLEQNRSSEKVRYKSSEKSKMELNKLSESRKVCCKKMRDRTSDG